MTSIDCLITGCQTSLQAVSPDLPHTLFSSRPSGFLSCLHVIKGVSSRVQRRHRLHLCKAPWSIRHRNSSSAIAMDSSASHRLALIEGSHLQERPDSTNDMFLYTHMLCPYAQTALLTLLHLVRSSESPPLAVRRPFLLSHVHCRASHIKWYILTYQSSLRGSHSCAETKASLQLFLSSTVVAKLKLKVLTSASRPLPQLS